MIPQNVTRSHILKALKEIDQNGIPAQRKARGYALHFQGKQYPPKYVVALANKFANGFLLPSNDFGGGSETNEFLTSRGFMVYPVVDDKQPEPPKPKRIKLKPIKGTSHNERCKACKETFRMLLQKLYGRVEINYAFDAGVLPEDYKTSFLYPSLQRIYQILQNHRGHRLFIRTSNFPRVDYFIPKPGFILEFDESQHFTACRKLALQGYPDELELGFDKRKWISICETTNAKDYDPPYRDEQRAWYDTLRDFLPSVKPLLPTIRLYSKSFRWCSLNPDNPVDVVRFKSILEGTSTPRKIEYRKYPKPGLARIIIAGDWDGNVEKSKELLKAVCAGWPENTKTHFLVTCGAFLTFQWPLSLPRIKDNKFPEKWVIEKLEFEVENHCRQLVDEEMRQKLLAVTDFITIGIDSYKEKISIASAIIKEPHVEMVALLDLRTGKYHWTGKSYPTTGQEDGLVRFQDLNSHFFGSSIGKVMVLGCHDLNIFNPRGAKTVRKAWRMQVRDDFYKLAKSERPIIVLHHPHTTDSSRIWTAAWNELAKTLPMVETYVGSGRYYNNGKEQRSDIDDVLQKTKMGNTLDIIVWDEG